ncbi:MAG: heavy metal-associated domain-containing protein [Gammaproteobacteria bacterium]|nr:heavy metal-associated domain-containing protein [Gammaproteobacteria bacterium]
MVLRNTVFALALMLIATPVLAQDYVVTVHGIVCSFCAQGVIKKVSKLPFVDRSMYTNGVKVEIEDQKVTVAVRDDSAIDTVSLFAAIESGGYDPIDVWTVSETGELTTYHP